MRAIACFLAIAFAPPLAAQDRAGYLQRMDTNTDGRVSLAEYRDWMSYAFIRMDRNGDGILAAAELPGGKGKPVTLETHHARLASRFRRQDRNGDGYLDAAELTAPPER